MKGIKIVAVLAVWLALGLLATFISSYSPGGHGAETDKQLPTSGE
ncbi:MAG: hypothetical protein ACYC2T_12080 [Bacillota bacterium]